MAEIVIQLPNITSKDRIEVEARINGQKRVFHYRVEVFAWEECEEPKEARAECLKKVIDSYDPDWRLQQIGAFDDKTVQIMFRHAGELIHQGDA